MSVSPTLPAGSKFGPYVIEEFCARGGMGMVYRAIHPGLKRAVALKVLYPHLAGDAEFAARFQREAQTLAQLRHENIVEVYDAGEVEGALYIAMEWLPGGTVLQLLKKLRDAGQLMPVAQCARIARQIALALEYAHGKGIIHRDLKPSNIMISGADRYVLGDFGIALDADATKLTGNMSGLGTVEYVSPEQGQGFTVDRRSDIYSLGCVLYEMLTGRVPYSATTPLAILNKHVRETYPPINRLRPDVPPAVQAIVAKAMAKKPADRYQTASAMAAALDEVLAGKTKAASPAPKWLVPAALGAVVLGGMALAAYALLGARPPVPAPTATPVPVATSAPSVTAGAVALASTATPAPLPTQAAPATSVITQVIVVVTATPLPVTATPIPPTVTPTQIPSTRAPTATRPPQTPTPMLTPTSAATATPAGLAGFSVRVNQDRAGYEQWGAPVPQYPCSGDNNRGVGKRFAWTLLVKNTSGADVSGMTVSSTATNGVPLVVCGTIPTIPNGQTAEISLYVLTLTPVMDVRVGLPAGAFNQRFCFDDSAAVASCDGVRPVAQVTPQAVISIQNQTGDNGPQLNMEAFEFQNGEFRKLGNLLRGNAPIEIARIPGRISVKVCRNQASDQCFLIDRVFDAGRYAILVVSYDMRAGLNQKCPYDYRDDRLQACIGVVQR